MSNLDCNEYGLLFTNGIGIGSLGSLIPLYSSPLCPQTPSALRERMANDYDHLQHLTDSNLSSGPVSWAMVPKSCGPESLGLPGSGPQNSHVAWLGGGHSLTRRRSNIEMAMMKDHHHRKIYFKVPGLASTPQPGPQPAESSTH
ncbi:hypothetical protein PPACK8108_LOCUS14701 [Phakopsora pachyrhizi]|uniref:Uncharacterized protein n=1 Tax=Phakopsora pachyrhizi TaxID=170000 RepID=A0AAV0B4Y0_PHAPC|nr:hypothetical protein PPACK8108_LOCUS14701 [Phakopsora pachyrhizi]